jgi:predicted acyl esterase
MRRLGVLLTLLAIAALPASAPAAAPPRGATWSETFIPTSDGERLHVDLLRPAGLAADAPTPVILVVSPYLGAASPDEAPGPNSRFYDFYEGANVFAKGYSVVQVATRGTGGSTGCLDILGPGEQTDIRTAVEFARGAPWSTGHVGMYGKSYDANLGTAAAALAPKGLDAVVAQETVPDRYRGSYNDRVRFLQSLAYPAVSYGSLAEQESLAPGKGSEYFANAAAHSADCQVLLAPHYLDDPASDFWTVRNFVARAKGSTVPTFMTIGYTDNNTNVGGGAVDFFDTLAGPKRLWIGWWDHVRGNDKAGTRLAMGREGWFDEVMRFYDEHLRGVVPQTPDPAVLAQGSDGKWRTETAWPPRDATMITAALKAGSYPDDGNNVGSGSSGPGGSGALTSEKTGAGAWTFSPPLAKATQLAGIPDATIDVAPVLPRTNVVVNVYDVGPDGKATMITRGAALVDAAGPHRVRMFPTDWTLAAGHRIGLLVSGANAEAYVHVPTNTTVPVRGGTVSLPFLPAPRVSNAAGKSAISLDAYKQAAPFTVPAATITAGTDPAFPLPPQR